MARVSAITKEANRLKTVAACQAVQAELESSAELRALRDTPLVYSVVALSVDLPTELMPRDATTAIWRTFPYNAGHVMKWHGETRVSSTGKLLFRFYPAMTPQLEARKVTAVEVAHTDLRKVFGLAAVRSISARLGDTVDTLIETALKGINESDAEKAKIIVDPEIIVEMTTKVQNWGAWA